MKSIKISRAQSLLIQLRIIEILWLSIQLRITDWNNHLELTKLDMEHDFTSFGSCLNISIKNKIILEPFSLL